MSLTYHWRVTLYQNVVEQGSDCLFRGSQSHKPSLLDHWTWILDDFLQYKHARHGYRVLNLLMAYSQPHCGG